MCGYVVPIFIRRLVIACMFHQLPQIRQCLQRPGNGRSDCDDIITALFRVRNNTEDSIRNDDRLLVDMIFPDIIRIDRFESAESDVQREIVRPDALHFQ